MNSKDELTGELCYSGPDYDPKCSPALIMICTFLCECFVTLFSIILHF